MSDIKEPHMGYEQVEEQLVPARRDLRSALGRWRAAVQGIPSRAMLRDGIPYENGPWDAARADIGGPCRHLARSKIGSGPIAWVADESGPRPDDYPETVSVVRDFTLGWSRRRWAALDGGMVITTAESLGHGERGWAIWPLEEEQEWLICEAHVTATGDSSGELFPDEGDNWFEDEV